MKISGVNFKYLPQINVANNNFATKNQPANFSNPIDKNLSPHENFLKATSLLAFTGGVYPKHPVKNYDSVERFSEKFLARTYRDFEVKNEKYIDNLVLDLCNKTGCDKKLAKEVLFELTAFENYSSIPIINYHLNNAGITKIATLPFSPLNLNHILYYLTERKGEILLNDNKNETAALFLDENVINYLSKNRIALGAIKKGVKSEKIKLFVLNGQNYRTKDGALAEYNLFSKTMPLEKIAFDVIKRIQEENISVDEAINRCEDKKLDKLFGNKTMLYVLRVEKKDEITTKDISDNLKPKLPNKDDIKKVVETCLNSSEDKQFSDKEKQEAILKYMDRGFFGFSSKSLHTILKERHKKIMKEVERDGKTLDDVVFVMPRLDKSFSIINYAYQKANNLPENKFINWSGEHSNRKVKGKTVVILDDISGSGHSLVSLPFDYYASTKNGVSRVIFSPLACLEQGKDYIEEKIENYGRYGKDKVITQVIKLPKDMPDELLFDSALTMGYSGCNSVYALPYMIPDCNNVMGSLLAGYFINNPKLQLSHRLSEEFYSAAVENMGLKKDD